MTATIDIRTETGRFIGDEGVAGDGSLTAENAHSVADTLEAVRRAWAGHDLILLAGVAGFGIVSIHTSPYALRTFTWIETTLNDPPHFSGGNIHELANALASKLPETASA